MRRTEWGISSLVNLFHLQILAFHVGLKSFIPNVFRFTLRFKTNLNLEVFVVQCQDGFNPMSSRRFCHQFWLHDLVGLSMDIDRLCLIVYSNLFQKEVFISGLVLAPLSFHSSSFVVICICNYKLVAKVEGDIFRVVI